MNTNISSFPFRRHALALALALATSASHATIINVKGSCTLISALDNADTDTDTDGINTGCPAGSGADIINLAANTTYTLTAINNNTDGDNGLPSISSIITINGHNATIKRKGDAPDFRLLHIEPQGNLTANKLKLTGGKAPVSDYYNYDKSGGGILNRGKLTLSNCDLVGNSAVNNGGAIGNFYGNATLTNCTVANNQAKGGGGIWNKDGSIALVRSTVSANSSPLSNSIVNYGGGNYDCNGGISLLNSTVSSNNAGGIQNQTSSTPKYYGYGGGGSYYLFQLCNTSIKNSTIAGNKGAGIDNLGYLGLQNTLIADNNSDCSSNTSVLTLSGINFIKSGDCNAQLSGDPRLGPLLDNGGPTLTRALLAGSPAVDQGPQSLCPVFDQRNVKRNIKKEGACDLGAFERMTTIPAGVSNLVQFFDEKVSIEAIVGITVVKREALRRQLLTAGHYKDRNLSAAACEQLGRSLEHIDLNQSPDNNDYVTGSMAGQLGQEIIALRTDWLCK